MLFLETSCLVSFLAVDCGIHFGYFFLKSSIIILLEFILLHRIYDNILYQKIRNKSLNVVTLCLVGFRYLGAGAGGVILPHLHVLPHPAPPLATLANVKICTCSFIVITREERTRSPESQLLAFAAACTSRHPSADRRRPAFHISLLRPFDLSRRWEAALPSLSHHGQICYFLSFNIIYWKGIIILARSTF